MIPNHKNPNVQNIYMNYQMTYICSPKCHMGMVIIFVMFQEKENCKAEIQVTDGFHEVSA